MAKNKLFSRQIGRRILYYIFYSFGLLYTAHNVFINIERYFLYKSNKIQTRLDDSPINQVISVMGQKMTWSY